MNLWSRIKSFNKFNLASYLLPGYRFNKIIPKVGIGIIFLWLLIAAYSNGFFIHNQVYIHCGETERLCENPFYDPLGMNPTCTLYGICDKETLLPGESFGSPPSLFMLDAGLFSFLVVFFCLLINHLLFNLDYFKPIIDGIKKAWKEDKL